MDEVTTGSTDQEPHCCDAENGFDFSDAYVNKYLVNITERGDVLLAVYSQAANGPILYRVDSTRLKEVSSYFRALLGPKLRRVP